MVTSPVLELRDVWLKIPVFTNEARSLKGALLRSVTGGSLSKSKVGAQIEAYHRLPIERKAEA